MSKLQGKIAIVTGGARGIGAGIAKCLTDDGATVAIIDLDEAGAKAAAETLSPRAIGIGADASDEKAMADAVNAVVAKLGGLDIMVNNAGGAGWDIESMGLGTPFTNVTQKGWDIQLQGNLRASFASCKAAIPHLQARGGGAIINIASIAGQMARAAKVHRRSLDTSRQLKVGRIGQGNRSCGSPDRDRQQAIPPWGRMNTTPVRDPGNPHLSGRVARLRRHCNSRWHR